MRPTDKAMAYAQILVTTWQVWDDGKEDLLDDCLRVTCEAARALEMSQVEGVIASPLNYFVRVYLDDDNPEDLTYCEMMDSMSVSIGLLHCVS
jgi:hypothetical protein